MTNAQKTRCEHGREVLTSALSAIPDSADGGKCPVCAYALGAGARVPQLPGPVDVDKTCTAISNQVRLLRAARATFPYMPPDVVGQQNVQTAPYYLRHGHHLTFSFGAPITETVRADINAVGYWINQNFILRLYAVLEAGKVIGNGIRIDKGIDGHKEVELVRRLRNKFSHGTGVYRATESQDRRLRKQLLQHFPVADREPPDSSGWFPIPIQKVLVRLAEGCERYVRGIYPGHAV